MKYVMSAIAETIDLLRKSQKLFILYCLIGLLPLLSASPLTPLILDIALGFLGLGWFASRYLYIDHLYRKKKLEFSWYRVLENLVKFALKLVPILALSALFLLIPVMLITLWYGRWFATSYLNRGLGLTTAQVWANLLPAVLNTSLWQEFFSQNILMQTLAKIFQILILVGLLAIKTAMIFLVVEKETVINAFQKAYFYLGSQIALVISFVFLRVFANVIGYMARWLLGVSFGLLISPWLAGMLFVIVSAALTMSLDMYIFSYYTKADHRNRVTKKIGRWWRGR